MGYWRILRRLKLSCLLQKAQYVSLSIWVLGTNNVLLDLSFTVWILFSRIPPTFSNLVLTSKPIPFVTPYPQLLSVLLVVCILTEMSVIPFYKHRFFIVLHLCFFIFGFVNLIYVWFTWLEENSISPTQSYRASKQSRYEKLTRKIKL